jgi:hypothetical protein
MRGPWERRKAPEYHKAEDFEKLQWVCGIPTRFWNVNLSALHPVTVQYENKKSGSKRKSTPDVDIISAEVQQNYLQARLDDPDLMLVNRFACITSYPSDEQGLAAACLLANAYLKKAWREDTVPRLRVDDIQDYEQCRRMDRQFYAGEPDILVLYNVDPNSSSERLSLIKDLVVHLEGTYRIVVAAADNPFQFARESLHVEPGEVYHFEGKPRKIVQI